MSEKYADSDVSVACFIVVDKEWNTLTNNGGGIQTFDKEHAEAIAGAYGNGARAYPAVLSWKQKNGPEFNNV